MPNTAQQLALDASSFFSEMAQVQSVLKEHANTLGSVASAYVRFNSKDDELIAGFKNLVSEGKRFTGVMKEIDGVLTPVITKLETVRQSAKAALEGFITAGSGRAKGLLSNIIGTDIPLSPQITTSVKKLQEQIAAQLGRDPGSMSFLNEQITALRKGEISIETGSRERQQALAIQILAVEQQITRERERQARVAARGGTNTGLITRTPLDVNLGRFAAQLQSALPVPPNASLGAFASYSAALQNVINIAREGKVPLADLQVMFSKLSVNPLQNLAGTGGNLGAAQSAIQRLLLSYRGLTVEAEKASTAAEQFTRGLFLGFSNIARLVQAQVIHRIFGNLITDMQNSISQAAEFDRKLAEVMTLGRNVQGIEQFRSQIAALSVEFNRSPADVAEGTYQALSNQVIRTGGDMLFMRQALQLAQATMSTTADSVNALSNVMNAYRTGTFDTERASDMLFRAVDLGRFRLNDLAQNMGRVTVTASQLGISLQEVLAFMTISTRAGVHESESITMLNGVMAALQRPTAGMKDLLAEWGTTSGEAALSTFGFVGVLQKLREEVDKGGGRLGELLPNLRGGRGFRAVRDTGAFQNEVSQIENSQGASAQAAQIIAESSGERFRSEFNKVTQFMTMEFGPKMLETILTVGRSFGGFSNMVKQVTQSVTGLIASVSILAQILGVISTIANASGLGMPGLVAGIAAYVVAVKFAAPITQILANVTEALTGANAQAAASQQLINTRLSVYAAQARGAAVSQNTLTAAQTTASAAARTLGSSLLAVSVALAPLAIITGGAVLVNWLNSASSAADETASRLAEIEQQALKAQEGVARTLSAGRTAFENRTRTTFEAWGQLLVPAVQAADALRSKQRELGQATHDNLANSLKAAADTVTSAFHYMQQQATQAVHNITESFKKINQERDKTQQTIFSAQSSFLSHGVTTASPFGSVQELTTAYQVNAAQNQIAAQQKILLQQRINQLQQQAVTDAARGDREGIEAARHKYDEVRRLTEQQFNIEIEQRRRALELGLRNSPTGGVGTLQVDFRTLSRSLEGINDQQAALERNFQNGQVVLAANNQALAQVLRERERVITESQHHLLAFRVTDTDNNLMQQFRGNNGTRDAMAQFEALAQAARAALQPIQLTGEELTRLRTRLGEQQAEVLRRGLQQGTISPDQVRQLEGNITQTRMQQLQQQLSNFAATQQQMRELERSIGEQRNQIAAQLARERAAAELKALTERLDNEKKLLLDRQAAASQLINDAGAARGRATTAGLATVGHVETFLETTGTIGIENPETALTGPQRSQLLTRFREQRAEVTTLARDYKTALEAFNNNQTEQNAQRARTALDALAEAFTHLQRTFYESRTDRLPPGLALEEYINRQRERFLTEGRNLSNSSTQEREGRTSLAVVERELAAVNIQTANVGNNLGAIAVAAAQMGTSIERGLGPTTRALAGVAEQIAAIATQLQMLNGGNPIVTPRPNAPAAAGWGGGAGGDWNAVPGFATGGLIGNAFTSRGPDNQLIFARTGEFVVNSESTRRFYSQLVSLNAGRMPRGYADGGLVMNGVGSTSTSVGDITINVNSAANPDATGRAVLDRLRREFRRNGGSLS